MNVNSQKGLTASLPLENEKDVTPVWNISDSLSSLFSFYYKQILFRDIASLLNKGYSPENIVIFDSEYHPLKVQLDIESKLFGKIEVTADNIVMLYELGFPYGMFPSKKILEMNLLFSFFDSINYELDIDHRFKSGKLKKAYRKYEVSGSLFDSFKYLHNISLNLLANIKDIKEKKHLSKKIDSKYNEYKKRVFELQDTLVKTDKINKSILKSKISAEELKKEKMYYSLYNKMYSTLYTRWIPLIAVYDNSNNSFKFLSMDVFKEIKNPYFFDLKEVSHNSPMFFEIAGYGLSILSIAFSVFAYYNPREVNKERTNFSDLIDLSDLSDEIKENVSMVLSEIENYNDLSTVIKLSISSHFIKSELIRLFNKTLELCGKTLADNGFNISTKKKITIYK